MKKNFKKHYICSGEKPINKIIMKAIHVIMVIAAAVLLCAPVQSAKAQNSTIANVASALTSQNGTSAGSALLGLYQQYKADKKLDFSNPTNIKNLTTLANNIKGLATNANTTNFLSGLIKGSKNLVNDSNSSSVLSSLKSLSNLDLSSLATQAAGSAAKSAASSLLSKVTKSSSSAAATTSASTDKAASILTSLFGNLK